MPDFAKWVMAAEPRLPWPAGTFIHHYDENRNAGEMIVVDNNPVGQVMVQFGDTVRLMPHRTWTGTATKLLEELEKLLPTDPSSLRTVKPERWPKAANILAGHLRRLAPVLRKHGIDVPPPIASKHQRTYQVIVH
jgi:hypothetical protein